MPELPEVETIVRDLRRLVTGATIREVTVYRADLIASDAADFAGALPGRAIQAIDRRAKNIVMDLGDDRLVVNLGMTGRLLVHDGDEADPPHLGVRFRIDAERQILYQDVRRFGRLELLPAVSWERRSAALGPEPLSPGFTPETLHRLTRDSRSPIKSWLMDQRRVVGVGNIYASEALFRAGVDPRKPARTLTRPRAERLHAAIQAVLREAIDFRGTTLLDYRDAAGQSGQFSARLRVYARSGEPCQTCKTPIRRIVQGGRSTFFCPSCQR